MSENKPYPSSEGSNHLSAPLEAASAKGRLLAFEGLDGAGKSTQAARLSAWLEERGRPRPLVLREPTYGPFGKLLRENARKGRDYASEMELLLKDRAQDVLENISPALAQGRTVIIDRYILSNAAYQGALPGGDPKAILAANSAFPWPDLTIILEVEVAEGLSRIGRRGETEEAFENAPYLSKVKEIYDRLSLPGVARLSSQAPPDEVFEAISKLAENLFSAPPLHPPA